MKAKLFPKSIVSSLNLGSQFLRLSIINFKKISLLLLLGFIIFSCNPKKEESFDSTATIEMNSEKYVVFDTLVGIPAFQDATETDSLYSAKFDGPTPRSIIINKKKYYIIEGDLLLSEYEYTQYKISHLVSKDTNQKKEKLIGEVRNNKIVKWPNNYIIKFCVAQNSFETTAQYNEVKANIKKAVGDWQNTCKVTFFYDEAKDSSNIFTPTGDLTFVVVGFDSNNEFIASAFFPYYQISERRLLIDPSYFTTKIDHVGILRHELGHILGFRHEHIRSEAPLQCQGEEVGDAVNITPKYDPKSVMHYFCGGMGTIILEISDIDRQGSQLIYGSPGL